MTTFTQNEIKKSLLKLLNTKPLKQITVKDIVNDCGINRNTFYYHYHDIPTLLEEIIKEEADKIIIEHPLISSFEECIKTIIDFTLKNKKTVLQTYHSINREIFEQYQWKICEHIVNIFMKEITVKYNISDSDYELISNYIKCVIFGIVIYWFNNDMDENIIQNVSRLCEIKNGNIELMLANCQKN